MNDRRIRQTTGRGNPEKYKPSVLWFDVIDMKSDAQTLDLYQAIRTLRPECVINSTSAPRWKERFPNHALTGSPWHIT